MKKNILITGAGSGIGRLAAIELAKRGHSVYATTHTKQQSDSLNNISKKMGVTFKAFKLDVLDKEDRQLVHDIKVDVLINNAAIAETGSIAEIPVERIKRIFETNIFGTIELTQEVLKGMVNRKNGRVIFVSSLSGRVPMPFFAPYCASKSAIEALAQSMRKELKWLKDDGINIEVGIIEPGAYDTGFNEEMMKSKYEWMDEHSYFKNYIKTIRVEELNYFRVIEKDSKKSIIKKYIKAVEDKRCKMRYISPFSQGLIIQLERVIGK